MRNYNMLAVLAMASGCGDSALEIDARVRIDSTKTADASTVDAPKSIDAPPISTATRVWVVGDFATLNRPQAGSFTDGDTLPVTLTAVPAAGRLSPNGRGFDVSKDGTKVAYLADSAVTGRFDIYLAGADGSNPVLVFQGSANVTPSNLLISPDASKIAFMSDPTLAGMKDLFVVAAAATSTPVQVTPTRAANAVALSVNPSYVWSPDSKYLAYSGKMTAAGFDEALIVDTSIAPPVAKFVIPKADIATGAPGTRATAAFDNAGHVYFRARLDVASQFKLFSANLDGTGRTVVAVAPARMDASAADIGAFAITPNGAKIVFAADAPIATTYNLYAASLADLANPIKLTNATVINTGPPFGSPLLLSPDASKVAFTADFETNGDLEPHVAKLDGTGDIRLFNITVNATDTEQLAWTRDGAALYCQGDLLVKNETRVFRFSASTADQTAVSAVTGFPVGNSDVTFTMTAPK
jgi:Tol biopolymer transport system component